MDLSVVIPVYNEEGNIEVLLREVTAALAVCGDYEVIYVDDASTDRTRERLHTLRPHYPRLRVIRHLRNCGQSAALLSGIRAARADWIVTLDGDGQNDPIDIPKLIRARDSARDLPGELRMVTGQRLRRADGWRRRFASRLANVVRRSILADDTADTGCGLKLFRRDALLNVPHFDHMHRFLPALIRRDGGVVITVPVRHRPRLHGCSKYGLFDRLWVGLVDLAGVLWLQHRPCIAASEEETP
ncbi:MAG: glycosyltransferase family 2 protein [Nitrococcus mobilis]|nr:glycosyltransferase family 2 protein [Nitrococcus mobilis]